MGTEIERKFLVKDRSWRVAAVGVPMRQGYLNTADRMAIRVRCAGDSAYLNIKASEGDLVTRHEYEYSIPVADAEEILDRLCAGTLIEKTRYRIPYEGFEWEVDVFQGENAGLVIAEIELESADQAFTIPPWVGDEVSQDPRYLNAYLSRYPFTRW